MFYHKPYFCILNSRGREVKLWAFCDVHFPSSKPIVSAVTGPHSYDTKNAFISPVPFIADEIGAHQDVSPGHRSSDHCQIPEQTGDGAGHMVLALP